MKKALPKLMMACLIVAGVSVPATVSANTPFVGEVAWVPYNFAPRGWAKCDGQLLPISSNTALFSLLGTTYGGDGRTTFGLPDMRGRTAVHAGQGPGLTDRRLGQKFGAETETLTLQQLPSHSHVLKADAGGATTGSPGGNALANTGRSKTYASTPNAAMNAGSVGTAGGNQAHNNMQPSTVLQCIIALQGIYPSRS